MKKEYTHFITGLLSNPKLSSAQKDKIFELTIRDMSKNGSDEKILRDLAIIKEKIGIKTQKASGKNVQDNGYNITKMTEEERDKWNDDVLSTVQNVVTRFELPKMSEEEKLGFKEQMPPEMYAEFFGENQEVKSSIIAKRNTKKNQPVENKITTEEFIKRKLDQLTDPDLALKDKKAEKKNISIAKFKGTANPKHVAEFMSLFNQREGLKYLTHDYDENKDFDIDKFLISANQVFIDKTKTLNIPQSLWRIVQQFAFDSKQSEWTSISSDYKKAVPVSIGWATKELRLWSKQTGLHPIRNKEYKKIIKDFKRITRIESFNFDKLCDITLEGVFKKDLESFDIQKTDLAKADFYSHVQFLKISLETIFEEIKKRSDSTNKKNISLKYERSISDDGFYLRKIIITHHNSFPTKELKLILKEWQEKGNMGKIKEKLMGYCHWSVETLIERTPIRVNILKEKDTDEYEQIKHIPEGFTHILTFYYK